MGVLSKCPEVIAYGIGLSLAGALQGALVAALCRAKIKEMVLVNAVSSFVLGIFSGAAMTYMGIEFSDIGRPKMNKDKRRRRDQIDYAASAIVRTIVVISARNLGVIGPVAFNVLTGMVTMSTVLNWPSSLKRENPEEVQR